MEYSRVCDFLVPTWLLGLLIVILEQMCPARRIAAEWLEVGHGPAHVWCVGGGVIGSRLGHRIWHHRLQE